MHRNTQLRRRQLCCCGVMKIETAGYLIVYVDVALLVGQLSYLAGSSMIYCCGYFKILWLIFCAIQAVMCVILFNSIRKRLLNQLKAYILVGIIGRALFLLAWIVLIRIEAFEKEAKMSDDRVVLSVFLSICVVVLTFCGILLFRCYLYFKYLRDEALKPDNYRRLRLCPNLDFKHREKAGLINAQSSTGHFLFHELDFGKLHCDCV